MDFWKNLSTLSSVCVVGIMVGNKISYTEMMVYNCGIKY